MCGIFGAIRKGKAAFTVKVLETIAAGQLSRGPHAHGFAWVDDRGGVGYFKAPGPITQSLDMLKKLSTARAIIGHTRYATHGSADNNINNHPHPVDGGWLVHNGIVSNYRDLNKTHGLKMASECDSETICRMIEAFRGPLLKRVIRAVSEVELWSPLAIAALWNRPGRVVLARRGNPLYYSEGTAGNIYFGSNPLGLPGDYTEFVNGGVWVYDLHSGEIKTGRVPTTHRVRETLGSGSGSIYTGCGPEVETDEAWSRRLLPSVYQREEDAIAEKNRRQETTAAERDGFLFRGTTTHGYKPSDFRSDNPLGRYLLMKQAEERAARAKAEKDAEDERNYRS